ncbi:MAG TPA: hypothetical protein VNV87_05610 [Acidimicrobiales bacterium]|nr:hypothetical protein [Acidimicrobiales bacterium]
MGGVVTGGGGFAVDPPSPGTAPEAEPDEGGGEPVPPLEADGSVVAPVHEVPAEGVVLDELFATCRGSEPVGEPSDPLGVGPMRGVPVAALAAELDGASGAMVDVEGAVDEGVAVPG